MSSVERETARTNPVYQAPLIAPRKQQSHEYEKVHVLKGCDSGAGNLTRIFFILAALASVMSLVSIVVTVLLLLGHITLHESCTCLQEQGAQHSTPFDAKKAEFQQEFETLAGNVTALKNALIIKDGELNETRVELYKLRLQIQGLPNYMRNATMIQGPPGIRGYNGSQGPPGPRGPIGTEGPQGQIGPSGGNGSMGPRGPMGPPGPPGSGDFRSCKYIKKDTSSTAVPLAKDATADIVLYEPSDKRIMGVTCSTNKGAEYHLTSLVHPTTKAQGYTCECKGESHLFTKPTSDTNLVCYMHYWECPLTT